MYLTIISKDSIFACYICSNFPDFVKRGFKINFIMDWKEKNRLFKNTHKRYKL